MNLRFDRHLWTWLLATVITGLTFAPLSSAQDTDAETPGQKAAKAFGPPPDATALSPRNLWIDRGSKRVYADGYVAMREGPLEMFACPVGTKEHESVVATIAKASDVHAALLAVGATQGTPVRVVPTYLPATGSRIRVWVAFRDDVGVYKVDDARNWIVDGDGKIMSVDWVFAGSSEWTDPSDNTTYYQANGGDMICVSNFATAMMDVPVASSADANHLLYRPHTDQIPQRGTPVRLILEPIAPTGEAPQTPDETVLPKPST